MALLISFLIAVAVEVVAYYLIKWLDSDDGDD